MPREKARGPPRLRAPTWTPQRRRRSRSSGLPLRTTDVSRRRRGTKHDLVQVQVHYTDSTDIPIIGRLLGDVQVTGAVSMRMEPG